MERTIDTIKHQELVREIWALERLNAIVKLHEQAQALDGLAY